MPGWTYSWTPLLLRLELARSALTRSDLPLCCQCHPPPVLLQPIQRKYFLGGLPKFIDEDEIKQHFITFGPLTVVWPHKGGSRTPLNGYAFALFHDEFSVHRLIKRNSNFTCLSRARLNQRKRWKSVPGNSRIVNILWIIPSPLTNARLSSLVPHSEKGYSPVS